LECTFSIPLDKQKPNNCPVVNFEVKPNAGEVGRGDFVEHSVYGANETKPQKPFTFHLIVIHIVE